MVTPREIPARQRSKEIIQAVNKRLGELRDPAMGDEADQAWRAWEWRRAEAEEAARHRAPAPPAAPPVKGNDALVTVAVLEDAMARLVKQERKGRATKDALLDMATMVGEALTAVNNRLVDRANEAERRLADLEARIAQLEGRGGD